MMTLKKNHNNGGFSLIEITVVVVIGGLLMAGFANSILSGQENAKITTTKDRLAAVDEALRLYYLTNYTLPCPAARNAPIDTPNYGIETDCTVAAVAGETVDATPFGGGAHRIRIGVVPTRTLGLPDSFGYDTWGGRLLYAVNRLDTDTATFGDSPNNSIDIIDTATNSLLGTSPGTIRFLTLSHGSDNQGAFSSAGTAMPACRIAEQDGENCNDDAVFRSTTIISDATTNAQYDDFVTYAGNLFKSEVPSGAVMAFNSAICPAGWTDAGMAGRVALGAGTVTYNAPLPVSTSAPLPDPQTFTRNDLGGSPQIQIDEFANHHVSIIPPHKILLYCEKL